MNQFNADKMRADLRPLDLGFNSLSGLDQSTPHFEWFGSEALDLCTTRSVRCFFCESDD